MMPRTPCAQIVSAGDGTPHTLCKVPRYTRACIPSYTALELFLWNFLRAAQGLVGVGGFAGVDCWFGVETEIMMGSPFNGAWCLVCLLCLLVVICVDFRCSLSFLFRGSARCLESSPFYTFMGVLLRCDVLGPLGPSEIYYSGCES